MSLLIEAVSTLGAWEPPTSEQADLRDSYLTHLAADPRGLWRDGPAEHLTASCFVLDPGAERTLLTLHRKGGFWVQFGGHLEEHDASLAAAARREGAEESGLPDLRLLRSQPFDLDRHALSAAFGSCREHLDVAFVAVVDGRAEPVTSVESRDVAWWPLDDLPPGTVPDLASRLQRVARAVRSAPLPA